MSWDRNRPWRGPNVRVFVRKAKVGWLIPKPNKTREEQIKGGLKQFRDSKSGPGKPSLFRGDSRAECRIAVAALASWDGAKTNFERIRKTAFVLVTKEDLRVAGLDLAPTESNIGWSVLRGRHFEITKGGAPCSDDDLSSLVERLIVRQAEHDSFTRDELVETARKYSQADNRCRAALAWAGDFVRNVLRAVQFWR